MKKIVLILLIVSSIVTTAYAQSTLYTFETGNISGATSFTSNSQSFTLGNNWSITNFTGFGKGGSDWYVDNFASCPNVGIAGSITTTDGADININSLWLYASNDCGTNTDGSVKIYWFKDGLEVHNETYAVNSGTPSGLNSNGFLEMDFDADGNACIETDEIRFELLGDLDYLALDDLTWTSSITNSSLTDVTSNLNDICPSTEVTITPNGLSLSAGAVFSWHDAPNGGGNNLGSTNPLVITPSATTTYYARIVGPCETIEDSIIITQTKTASELTSISADKNNIAASTTVQLTPIGLSLGTSANFTWYDGPNKTGTNLGSAIPLTVSPSVTTTYYGYVEGECNFIEESITVFVVTSTETFETGNTNGATSFTNGAQNFNLGNNWSITNFTNFGKGGSDWYVDNFASCPNTGIAGSITTADGADININSLWLYASNDCGTNTNGSVKIYWFKDGSEVHNETYAVNSGTPSGLNSNGFLEMDFDADGNACIETDEIRFELLGDLNYLALDDLAWRPAVISSALTDVTSDVNDICTSTEVTITANGLSLGTSAVFSWHDAPNGGGNNLGSANPLVITPGETTTYYARIVGPCETIEDSVIITQNKTVSELTSISTDKNDIIPSATVQLTPIGLSLGTSANFTWYDGPNKTGTNLGSAIPLTVSPSVTTTYYGYVEGECNFIEESITISVVTSTETFETGQTNGAAIFSSGSQNFNLGNDWRITNANNFGKGGSDWYIDNSTSCPSVGIVGSITTTDGADININSLWLYASNNCGINTDGSVRIYWFKDGLEVHNQTYAVNSGTPSGINSNGFLKMNFEADGNSCIATDEIRFELLGDLNYLALDDLTWTTSIIGSILTDVTSDANDVCPSTEVTITPNGLILGTGAVFSWHDAPNGGGNNLGSSNPLVITPSETTTYYARIIGPCETIEDSIIIIQTKTNSELTSVSSDTNNIFPSTTVQLTPVELSLGTSANFTWYDGPGETGTNLGSSNPLIVEPSVTTTYYGYVEGECNFIEESITILVDRDSVLSNENFEVGLVTDDSTFISNGQGFTVSDNWLIKNFEFYGRGGSNWYVDNVATCPNSGVSGSIRTTDGADVYFSEVWLYASEDCETNNNGAVRVYWYKDNIEIHNKSYLVNSGILNGINSNGFLKINLSDEVSNCISADELQFELLGDLDYLALDNMLWAKDLPPSGCNTRNDNSNSLDLENSGHNGRLVQAHLYPNPANNKLNISLFNNGSNSKLKIYDGLGTLIKSFSTDQEILTLDVNDLQNGFYLIDIENNGNKSNLKFVKQ